MQRLLIGFIAFSWFGWVSCTSSEIGNSKDVNPDAVFYDYKVWSEEGKEEAVVKLQYRMGGPDGTTLVLNEPSKVFIDGKEIPVDSTKFDGAYYEFVQPMSSFAGKHEIRFIDLNGKEFREGFEFRPFFLDPDLPAQVSREDLVLQFRDLEPDAPLQIWISDTAFSTVDINLTEKARDGKVLISKAQLQTLASGPLNVQITLESEQALKESSKEGGRLMKTYGLRREIELKD